jgi:hypothetical protein
MSIGLGSSVKTLRTGIQSEGVIVAINHPVFFKMTSKPGDTKVWDELYPDWETKVLYTVLLTKPQKSCTYKEFSEGLQKRGMHDIFEIRKLYNEMPDVQALIYPSDDLEEVITEEEKTTQA